MRTQSLVILFISLAICFAQDSISYSNPKAVFDKTTLVVDKKKLNSMTK